MPNGLIDNIAYRLLYDFSIGLDCITVFLIYHFLLYPWETFIDAGTQGFNLVELSAIGFYSNEPNKSS